jgi:transcriptional regulator with XRE-family HTH domain
MLLLVDQRRRLGAFLRARREALTPATVGLPRPLGGRSRTPGLRREEVAQLCGLSTTWYTWLEQGRDIALSAAALARVAEALQLSAAERAYVFGLTQRRDPTPPTPLLAPSAPPGALQVMLRATAAPAYLMDRLWCARGWNDAAGRLFSPWFGSGEACLLRYVFLQPTARDFIEGWEDRGRRLVAEFRADTALTPDDPGIVELVGDLSARSNAFASFWNDHEVRGREGGVRVFNHPSDGTLRYEQVTFVPAAYPGYKLVVLLPE